MLRHRDPAPKLCLFSSNSGRVGSYLCSLVTDFYRALLSSGFPDALLGGCCWWDPGLGASHTEAACPQGTTTGPPPS